MNYEANIGRLVCWGSEANFVMAVLSGIDIIDHKPYYVVHSLKDGINWKMPCAGRVMIYAETAKAPNVRFLTHRTP